MAAGIPIALMLLGAQAYGPKPAVPAVKAQQPKPSPATACPVKPPTGTEILVCVERPNGYRINPDVMEARREVKSGRPPPPPGRAPPSNCGTVGPMPCLTGGINLMAAAITAATMAQRLAKGQEIGSMFVTDPHPSEYQLYQMAKKRRETEEAEKKARAQRDAAAAAIARANGN